MEGLTRESIAHRMAEVLTELKLDVNMPSLMDYFVADELSQLKESRVVRWFNLQTAQLTSGGILVAVEMHPTGALLRIKQVRRNRFWNVRFNDAVIFQRLTPEEQAVLFAKEYA